ncbi:MAG: alternative ribosome rescue aminoacyl-tRNA hydrolase ArfB [Planctomycetota bacterium]|jgi:ribosome-associated protein
MSDSDDSLVSVAPGVDLPADIVRFSFDRSRGPGGQNVNKLNTRATLTVDLTDLAKYLDLPTLTRLRHLAGARLTDDDRLILRCETSRSQLANRRECVEKLRQLIVQAMARPKRRRPTKPSRAAKERRLKAKKVRSDIKRQRSKRDF